MADLADARRRAEEWLTRYDDAVPSIPPGSADPPEVRILRALLAALTAEGEGKTCPGCGGLGWIPAGDEQLGCIDCNGTGHAPAPPPRPAQDAVREAAEVVRTILTAHDARLSESGVLTYGPPSKGTGFVAAIQWLRRYDAARGGE